jgi:hypothetical protein
MLADLVRRCRSADHLPALFAHLGYEKDDGPVADGWRAVARWRTFRVIGTDAPDPSIAARTMARRLAATAQPGLVAAVGGGTLALATPRLGTVASSPVLALAVAFPEPLHLQLLTELAPKPDATALEHALRTGDVLASEGASERFFEAFRGLYVRAQAAAPARANPADRTLLALLPLTRILFLYFVQAKGWLDGRPDFLRAALDDALARRRKFHRSVLQPLCFGTLNRPVRERADGRFGRIPYLNGGLFEPHPAERAHGPLVLPNPFWRDAFDQVFERFRFCVREGEHVDAIAPDMLGRTFERIMQRHERKASGTFYTPERLVRELVVATLATALEAPELPHERARALLTGRLAPNGPRRVPVRRLLRLRVLDPAAGSGAFLLGALDVLTDAWTALGAGRDPAARARLRRRIVARQLCGVDVNPVAVRLAELRLWLALIADDPETDVARVTPLPNLNGVVRQGDTLLDPIGAARALGIHAGPATPASVTAARRAVFAARGPARSRALSDLRATELEAARDCVTTAIEHTRAALHDLIAAARGRDLFGRRSGLSRSAQIRYRALRAHLRALRTSARHVALGSVPFFAFEVHYPRAAAGGGFDAVIGNPPWVRAERLPAGVRATLGARFRWWRAEPRRGFAHQPDLAVAFLERAVELTRPGGAIGFLLPSKISSAGYAETARHALVRETSLAYVHRVSERAAREFRAAVYPLALVIRKEPPSADHQLRLDFRAERTLAQGSLAARGPWVLAGDGARRALERLCAGGPPLGTVAPPVLGVKTGADPVFVGRLIENLGDAWLVRFGDEDVPLESDLLRPAIRGRDLRPFQAAGDRVLLWPHDRAGAPRRSLPPLAARWLHRHQAALERRSDFRGGPPWVLFRTTAALVCHRVVWPDLARSLHAVALDVLPGDAVPLNTCYVSATPDESAALALAATLNSTWIRVLLRLRADEARGGYRRHNARVMGAVPVPPDSEHRHRLVELSRDAHHTHDVCQQDLDRAVAQALRLDAGARADLVALARDHG